MRPSAAPGAQSTAPRTPSAALRGTDRWAGVQEAGGSRCSLLSASPCYSLLIIRGQRAALTAPHEAPQWGWISVASSAQLHRSRDRPEAWGAQAGLTLSGCKGDRGKAGGSGGAAGSRSWRKDSPRPAPRPSGSGGRWRRPTATSRAGRGQAAPPGPGAPQRRERSAREQPGEPP